MNFILYSFSLALESFFYAIIALPNSFLGFLGYIGKHPVQALPFVYTLQCLTGKCIMQTKITKLSITSNKYPNRTVTDKVNNQSKNV